MKLAFANQVAVLAHFNARAEVNGEDREPACDLKLELTGPNDELSKLHPSLKALLYHYDATRPSDLADEGKKHDPEYLPHLRFPQIKELRWADEMPGMVFTLHGAKSDLVLAPVKVNNVVVHPMEGGSAKIALRVQGHPDEKQAGRLATTIQQEIEFSLSEQANKQTEIPAGE